MHLIPLILFWIFLKLFNKSSVYTVQFHQLLEKERIESDLHDFDKIMDEHSKHLLRIAYLYVKNWDTAEDIVQEVFIKHFLQAQQFEGRASLKTYLTVMTANKSKDYLRSWQHKRNILVSNLFSSTKGIGIDTTLQQQEEHLALHKAIFKLPIKYREPLILFYYDEQSITEIATFLKSNENTIKTRLRRAKQHLKRFMEESDLGGTYE